MDAKSLWFERFQAHVNEWVRYMRLIANSGLVFSLFLLVIFGSYYYGQLLNRIPDAFPLGLVVAILITITAIRSPYRTFLQQGDLVFLLPMEKRLTVYFQYTFIYNVLLQAFFMFAWVLLFVPMYGRLDGSHYSNIWLFVLSIVLSSWNVGIRVVEDRFRHPRVQLTSRFVRMAVTFVFLYLFVQHASVLLLAVMALLITGLYMYYHKGLKSQHLLNWECWIEMDEALRMRFYRFASLFTDVPKIRQQIKKRPLLRWWLHRLPLKRLSTFSFLYRAAFLRAGDYAGIYVRLAVIGAIIIVLLPEGAGRWLGSVLFLYLFYVQFRPIQHHFRGREQKSLYPLAPSYESYALQKLLRTLLAVESFFFAMIAFVSGSSAQNALLLLSLLIGFSFVLTSMASKKWQKQGVTSY